MRARQSGRVCCYLSVLLLLAACTPPPKPPVTTAMDWPQRQALLQSLEQWHFTGRLAISVEDEGWQASLDWQQYPQHYLLRILAPLGMGGAELRGNQDGVTLIFDSGQRPLFAPHAEDLLDAMYGWSIPVEKLRYWLVGVPAPDSEASVQLDQDGRVFEMQTGEWQVSYQRYGQHHGYELPEKLTLKRPGYRLRLVISAWQL